MTASNETSAVFPENLVEIAEAIAIRSNMYSEMVARAGAALAGEEYVPPTESLQKERLIGQTALNMLRVENPHGVITLKQAFDALEDKSKFEEIVSRINAGEDDETFHLSASNFANAQIALTEELLKTAGQDDGKRAADFAKAYESACVVASEHGVSIAEVYRSDALYYESYRRISSPEEFVTEIKAAIEIMNGETLTSAMVRHFEKIVPKALLVDMSPDEITEIIAEMQLDPELSKMMDLTMELSREAMRQAGTFMFLRIYGYDALSALDPTLRDNFIPTQAWLKEIFAESTNA